MVPKRSRNNVVAAPLTSVNLERQRSRRSSVFGDNVNLEWVPWRGSLPNGAVSVDNSYTGRRDYVCKYGCYAGFYSPSLGQNCQYPREEHEYSGHPFEILVNRDNFEFLEWKQDSSGSVPQNSVKTCEGTYVGKNRYGLGKVVSEHKAFFLPWEGDEYWYKYYEVLTINRDVNSQHISDVKYNIDKVAISKGPSRTMQISKTINNACQAVTKTVQMSKRTEVRNTWNFGSSTTLGITTSMKAGIPFIGAAGIEVSVQQTIDFSKGTTKVEARTHSVSIQISVPPNHTCEIRMEGRKITADIPYTARLSHTYSNGETRWKSISGKYTRVDFGQFKAVVDRCEPVIDAEPCV
ncbi:uncharacterized protein V6R79_018009 [Siganus canaliculatus]